ncbi:hypothetical protein KFE25_009602 [Diacronema lutheri]|uniref:Uncharacterized protein n=1 Tax=Diacronema lutheri TaxID=2081491 RepID=A0A8J5XY45_DIALT|nr:hypothetical protein KFE25_009602 [Diacronema lutheri]
MLTPDVPKLELAKVPQAWPASSAKPQPHAEMLAHIVPTLPLVDAAQPWPARAPEPVQLMRLFALPHNTLNVAPLTHRRRISAPGTAFPPSAADTPPTVWAHDGMLYARPWGPEHKPIKLFRRGRVDEASFHEADPLMPPFVAKVKQLYGQPIKHLLAPPPPDTARGARSHRSSAESASASTPYGSPRGSVDLTPHSRSPRGSIDAGVDENSTVRSARASVDLGSTGRSPRNSFASAWETTSCASYRPYSSTEMCSSTPRRASKSSTARRVSLTSRVLIPV